MDEIILGTVLEKGNAAPTGGLTSIFTVVPAGTPFTLNAISTSSPGCSEVTALLPIVVVNVLVESLVPWVRITGSVTGVEKTISSLVRSTAGDCGKRSIEKVTVSIPACGLEDNP